MTRIPWLAAAVVALVAPAAGAQPAAAVAAKARQVLKTHCHRCHHGDGSSSTYEFDVTNHDSLTKVTAGVPWVVGHSLQKSELWDAVQKRMPQRGSPERETFGDAEREVLKAWIEAGAPPFPPAADRPFVSLKDVLTAIRDHLAKAPAESRPYLRYFSLANAHNNPATFTDEDLRHLRAALSKVLNSLSWKARIVVPEAVDRHATVLAVDVRGLDWDRGDLWQKVTDAYPYGLRYGNHPDPELKELDARIMGETRCDLPWVRADWFVASASRPPLYHNLLQLPQNARELEAKLDVNVLDNFRRDTLARAGFMRSGVSGQNRLVERHDAAHGAYWASYDFGPGAGRGNLVRFPLGPAFPENPFAGQAFHHDGGEVIFNLPNGLQGYMLVNAKGGRIDAGPIDIVGDDKRVSGTPAIVNGISCMACHQHGTIPFKDTIRDTAAVLGAAADKVRRLYPEQKAMDALVEADRKRFLAALEKTVGPFLRVGAEKDAPLLRFREPVSEVAIGYRRGYLDARTVAAELFVQNPDDLAKLVGAPRLRELGLDGLTRPGGLIGRYQWEATDGFSLMQETAAALGYTPYGK